MKKLFLAIASIILCFFAQAGGAPIYYRGLSVSVEPQHTTAAVGDVFSVNIMYEPLINEPPLAGGYDVLYDPKALVLIDYELDDVIWDWLQIEPIKEQGALRRIIFGGCVNQPNRMATLTFQVIGDGGTKIELAGSAGHYSWNNGCVDFVVGFFEAIYYPGFVSVSAPANAPIPLGPLMPLPPQSL